MKKALLPAILLAAALPASAGPYDQAWSTVESGDNSEVRKESRVAISKIDDQSPKNPRRGDPLPPGKHKVRISWDTGRGVVTDNFRELDMDLEPCVRYRIVAAYTNKTSPEWKPTVYTEPIPECKKKFGAKK
jgi:hypothetical protein